LEDPDPQPGVQIAVKFEKDHLQHPLKMFCQTYFDYGHEKNITVTEYLINDDLTHFFAECGYGC
jgi:hypothetical protein